MGRDDLGRDALALYFARVRAEWYAHHRNGQAVPDLSIFDNDLLHMCHMSL